MRFKAFALLNTEKTQQMKLKILMWHFAQYSSPSIPSRKRNFLLNEKTLNCCEERERERLVMRRCVDIVRSGKATAGKSTSTLLQAGSDSELQSHWSGYTAAEAKVFIANGRSGCRSGWWATECRPEEILARKIKSASVWSTEVWVHRMVNSVYRTKRE